MTATIAFDQDWSQPALRTKSTRLSTARFPRSLNARFPRPLNARSPRPLKTGVFPRPLKTGVFPALWLTGLSLALIGTIAAGYVFLSRPMARPMARQAAMTVSVVSIDLPPPVREPQVAAPAAPAAPPVTARAEPAAPPHEAPEKIPEMIADKDLRTLPEKTAPPPVTPAETAVQSQSEMDPKTAPEIAPETAPETDIGRWDVRVAFAPQADITGKVESLTEAGNRILAGDRTPDTYRKALPWFLMAAQEGSALGAFNAGQAYRMGRLGRRPDRTAAKWYRKAAAVGYAPAKLNLGLMYLLGDGVEKNSAQGLKWIGEAAADGNAKALKIIARYGS